MQRPRQEQDPAVNGEGEKEEEEESDWEKPASYNLLLSSLKASKGRNSKKRKRESEAAGNGAAGKAGKGEEEDNMEDHVLTKLDRMTDSATADGDQDDEDEDGGDARDDRYRKRAQGVKKGRGDQSAPLGHELPDLEDDAEDLTETERQEAEEHDEFSTHFGDEFSNDIKETVELFQEGGELWQNRSFQDPTLGTVTVYDVLDVDDSELAVTGNRTLDDFFVKRKLHAEWLALNGKKPSKKAPVTISEKTPFTDLQCKLFGSINKYKDCLFPQRALQNSTELRNLYCLHAMNHVFK